MSNDRPIIIAGFMGSGKTTVAKALGRELGWVTIDLDQHITVSNGRSPKDIIEQDGEQSFRELETRSLQQVLQNSVSRVIALGGGAWMVERNRQLISEQGGRTVWLNVPFDVCWQRISATRGERPLAPDRRRAQILYDERRPHYALAELHIEVAANRYMDEVAAEIAEALRILDQ